jgi:hypothetical protein
VQAGDYIAGLRLILGYQQLSIRLREPGREQPGLYLAGHLRGPYIVRRASVDQLAQDAECQRRVLRDLRFGGSTEQAGCEEQ